ncbi:MAG: hypothetical protein KJN64_04625 [Ignavibacteria bacterium]|nr:hypothetical protein [Ignavibacteria bacterium]
MYYKNIGMEQVKESFEDELVEILVFNKEDILNNNINFKWIHSHEFKYNGEMYDIVKKEEKGDQLTLHCINDKNEKKLEEEFAKRVEENSSNSKQRQKTNHFNVLISEPVKHELVNFNLCGKNIFNICQSNFYNSLYSEIPSPPPRLV